MSRPDPTAKARQAKRLLPTNSARWRAIRAAQLRREPLCRFCLNVFGRVVEATHVDHANGSAAKPEDYAQTNLQSLCASCHSTKTAIENGAFGNKPGGPASRRRVIGLDGYPIEPK